MAQNGIAKMRDTPLDENEIAKLRMLIARDVGPKVPWYKAPSIPRTFKFVPGAAPVFPAHVRANTITKPKHKLTRCYGGPFDGEAIDVCSEDRSPSLIFSVRGFTGCYEVSGAVLAWVPAI